MKTGSLSNETGAFWRLRRDSTPQKTVFDMKTVTRVQFFTEEIALIDTAPENVLSIEIHILVPAWPDSPPSPAKTWKHAVSYAKIVLKDAHAVTDENSGDEGRQRAYERLVSENLYSMRVQQNGAWKSYHFPVEWIGTKGERIWVDHRVTVEQDANGRAVITACEISDISMFDGKKGGTHE
jgi:hypothetical protein